MIVAAVEINAETVPEGGVGLRLKALGDGAGLKEIDGLARWVEHARVTVVEVHVKVVGVEGKVLELENGSGLVGGVLLLFGENGGRDHVAGGSLVVVEDAGGRNDAALRDLNISRPVVPYAVVDAAGWQRGEVTAAVGDEGVGVNGGVFRRVAGAGDKTADGLAVISKLLRADGVVGELDAWSDVETRGDVPLKLDERLIAVGDKLLGEIRQELIGPVVERVGGVLVAVGVGPLVPHTSIEDAEFGDLADPRDFAVLAVAVVLVDGAGQRADTLLAGDDGVAGR